MHEELSIPIEFIVIASDILFKLDIGSNFCLSSIANQYVFARLIYLSGLSITVPCGLHTRLEGATALDLARQNKFVLTEKELQECKIQWSLREPETVRLASEGIQGLFSPSQGFPKELVSLCVQYVHCF